MASYDHGDAVTLTMTFTNLAGTPTDPTTVTLKYEDPSGNQTTKTYAAAQITRTGTGVYTYTITTDEAGTWTYRWIGTGAVEAVEEGYFYVLLSDFETNTPLSSQLSSAQQLALLNVAFTNSTNAFTDGQVFQTGVAIGASYTDVPAGRALAIVAPTENYGIEVVHNATDSDGIASYNKGEGAAAFYAEITADSAATTLGYAFRAELRKNLTTLIGYIAADYVGTADAGFKYDGQKAGGVGFLATNTHEASPSGGFTGLVIVDSQQSGATSNAGVDVRQYQDSLDAFVLRDAQRSDGKAIQMRKDATGGKVRVNKADGTERATVETGSAGARGVLKLWDVGAGAFRYAYIDSGAWVIGTSEPT